jgi:hypothetical protein
VDLFAPDGQQHGADQDAAPHDVLQVKRCGDHVRTVVDSAQRQHTDECAEDIGLAMLDRRYAEENGRQRIHSVGFGTLRLG